MLAKFLAQQLGAPSGLVGRFVVAPLWNRRNAALNDVAFDNLSLRSHDRVLEVGFGGGYLLGRVTAVVTDGFVAGVDASEAMVAVCKRRYRPLVSAGKLELLCATAESLPYPAGRFSRVCTVNSLFYWTDVPQALAEMHRVLAEGGRLVVCITCKASLEDRSFARGGLALYEDAEVCRMVQSAGFRGVEMSRAADRHREFMCIVGVK